MEQQYFTITARVNGELKFCFVQKQGFSLNIIKGCREIRSIVRNICADPFKTTGQIFDLPDLKLAIHSARMLNPDTIATYMGSMCSVSGKMLSVFHDACLLAGTEDTVLLRAETGCGKELLARAIHISGRDLKKGQFIPVNCAAIPSELLEAELFGYERGAFTGAYERREGAFHAADGGTLFLDEIGELSHYLQPKLLRALDSGEIKKIGENAAMRSQARVIAATNRDLVSEVMAGRFRSDLYHRIACIILTIPPLRERKEDIPFIAGEILKEINSGKVYELSGEATVKLMEYDFPGNVRELKNMLKRAMFRAQGKIIMEGDIEINPYSVSENFNSTGNVAENTDDFYSSMTRIKDMLCRKRNISRSLKSLGIPRSTFYKNYYPALKNQINRMN